MPTTMIVSATTDARALRRVSMGPPEHLDPGRRTERENREQRREGDRQAAGNGRA